MSKDIETQSEIYNRTKALLSHLSEGLYEKQAAVNLAFLSAMAGESIFLLGPPGVGKSLVARRLKFAFLDGVSFEYLMSKFSTPDEVFGPISIQKLKDQDKYERLTDRYLPGANIVFLDEIWKAGPAIQNALLTILNEKIYRNGDEDLKVNIHGIITASNELPTQNANLAPIWDRFLIRLEMGNIRKMKDFIHMITDTTDLYKDNIPEEIKISNKEIDQFYEKINQVEIGPEVLNTIQLIKIKIEEHNVRIGESGRPIVIHDRRWKKIIRLLRTSAFLNGRSNVDLMDCFLMKHCLWNHPDHCQVIIDIISAAIEKHGFSIAVNLQALKREIQEFTEDVDQEIRVKNIVSSAELMPFYDEYFKLKKQEDKFSGVFISIKQYRTLKMDEPEVTNFYDEEKNLVNRIKVAKGRKEHSIDVYRDSNITIYHLETRITDQVEYIDKKPHPVLQKFWDEKHAKLSEYINTQLDKLKDSFPAAFNTMHKHLFVSEEYIPLVQKNYREVEEQLKQLQLQLEKLQFRYLNS